MKQCSKCQANKPLDQFYEDKRSGGRRNPCILCQKSKQKYYDSKRIKQKKQYYNKNQINILLKKSIYYQENKVSLSQKHNQYQKDRKFVDVNFKISCNLRSRLNRALKGNYKSGSSIRNLGCSVDELKQYLESKFQEGMTWENYGKNGWHIDHVVPLSKFNLSETGELLKACYYTNLQPMWAKDNIRKSNL